MKAAILEKAFKDEMLIGIRTEMIDCDETIIGFIKEISTDAIFIQEIDEFGFEIGSTFIDIKDVVHIDLNDRYQKRLRFLYEHKSRYDKNIGVTLWNTGKLLVAHINKVIENKTLSTIYFDEEHFVSGIPQKHDTTYIEIKNIGDEGDVDGFSFYPIDSITGIAYDRMKEQKISMLYENRSNFY